MKEQWYLTSEILPDEGIRVLVYTVHKMYGQTVYYKRDITIGIFENGKWKCEAFLGNNVIAWMRLPKTPEEV